jgi:L-alanine-DL-glutamate epimerase-like enolase superfamily enzyme
VGLAWPLLDFSISAEAGARLTMSRVRDDGEGLGQAKERLQMGMTGDRDATVELSAMRLRCPLKSPYRLAFGMIEAFDTVLVTARVGGVAGYGEATVLTGYTEETIEGSWGLARDLVARHPKPAVADILAAADALTASAPFTATAFRTAIEMAARHPLLSDGGDKRVALLAIINASTEPGIAAEVEARLAEGYTTLKIKAGFEREADLSRVRFIQSLVAGTGVQLTVDANQGFSRDDGCAFAAELCPDNIAYFEQACDKHDWEAAVAVAQASSVPVMLDESIYDLADVERAASLGAARFVKLKLMKCGGLDKLTVALERVRALGLRAVLGNGVATDIGCWMEAAAGFGRIDTAGEMNGFLKLRRPLLRNSLTVAGGYLEVPAGWWPIPDDDAIQACRLDAAGF